MLNSKNILDDGNDQGASLPANIEKNNFNLESVIGYEALYESMEKCKRGVMWKNSVAHYVLNGAEETLQLAESLHNETYTPRPPAYFQILHPKKREIISISFIDRVYQRSLNDNAIYPIITKGFIYDNCACQKGKGTDFARNRLKQFLRKYYMQNHKNSGYVLQIDIKGYYPNMSHKVVREKFQKELPLEIASRAMDVLDGQYKGDKGYNPGSQMVQIAGISVLDGLDHFIKEKLHIKCYVRYMDDLILIHKDEKYLELCYAEIGKRLAQLQFEFNKTKTKIYSLENGIPFLGFTFKLTNTGKVLLLLLKKNLKHEKRKLCKFVAMSKRGEMSRERVDACYASWRNHASKGNSFLLLQRMDSFYKDLWGEKNGKT